MNFMEFEIGTQRYRWIENWLTLPNSDSGWAHHGLANLNDASVSDDHKVDGLSTEGCLVTGHSTRPELYFLDLNGRVLRQLNLPVSEIHHICPGKKQTLFICDIGSKDLSDQYATEPQVIEFDLQGKTLRKFTKETFGYGQHELFKPTCTAMDHHSNRIWVADGYGSSKVHCLDYKGELLFSLDGREGAGRFDCPHTVFIDERKNQGAAPKVLIADRSNHRIQMFSLEGDFLGLLDIPGLITPSAFLTVNELLLVVELEARLHVLACNNQPLSLLFDGSEFTQKPGWPNRIKGEQLIAPDDLQPGKLNSPHSICLDAQHNIYISEWLIGDRFIKLEKLS